MQAQESVAAPGDDHDDRPAQPARRRWPAWISAALFALVVTCFVLPFASTSCTLPGGYGRGGAGTSTVYRGVDLTLGTVPDVTPSNRPAREGAGPDDGSLGFQPLTALALLAAVTGVVLSLLPARGRGIRLAAWAVLTAALLVLQQAVVVGEIAGRIDAGLTQALPPDRTARDYVNTGLGFVLALLLTGLVLALNATLAALVRRRRGGANTVSA